MEEIQGRLAMGKEKYGHGVRVDDDTTTWGTSQNSWMEMAREEFLDAIVYVTADYIREGRQNYKKMSNLEIDYQFEHGNEAPDDNMLIQYILSNWMHMEPCKHKTMLNTLFNLLGAS